MNFKIGNRSEKGSIGFVEHYNEEIYHFYGHMDTVTGIQIVASGLQRGHPFNVHQPNFPYTTRHYNPYRMIDRHFMNKIYRDRLRELSNIPVVVGKMNYIINDDYESDEEGEIPYQFAVYRELNRQAHVVTNLIRRYYLYKMRQRGHENELLFNTYVQMHHLDLAEELAGYKELLRDQQSFVTDVLF
jgi:hypothetical protein